MKWTASGMPCPEESAAAVSRTIAVISANFARKGFMSLSPSVHILLRAFCSQPACPPAGRQDTPRHRSSQRSNHAPAEEIGFAPMEKVYEIPIEAYYFGCLGESDHEIAGPLGLERVVPAAGRAFCAGILCAKFRHGTDRRGGHWAG